MAPLPPTRPTCPHRHRKFLRPLLLLAILQPATSQFFQPSPPDPSYAEAFSPPSSAGGGGASGGSFNLTTSLLFVGLILALFLLGIFSAYLRRFADAATPGHGGRGVNANTAFATAAAAAFATAAAGGRRRTGLDVAVMEALPVMTYATARALKAGRGALECAVCLAKFADDDEKLRLLPGCCHVFHAVCIDLWLAAHVTCPVCRANLADPAVAAAGHVLAADLAAQADMPNDQTVVTMDTSQSTTEVEQAVETAEERADRYTLRLPNRLRREIEEAKRHRRAVSAVTAAAIPATSPSERWTSTVIRTMSAARPSRQWSALLRALSGTRRSELDGSRRVVPEQAHTTGASNGQGGVEVVVVQDDVGAHLEKYYVHSLTFAGFTFDGDIAAGDWNPDVFQVSTTVQVAAASRR